MSISSIYSHHIYNTHRNNPDRAMELAEKGIQFSRSRVEMAQAYVVREKIKSQQQAFSKYLSQ